MWKHELLQPLWLSLGCFSELGRLPYLIWKRGLRATCWYKNQDCNPTDRYFMIIFWAFLGLKKGHICMAIFLQLCIQNNDFFHQTIKNSWNYYICEGNCFTALHLYQYQSYSYPDQSYSRSNTSYVLLQEAGKITLSRIYLAAITTANKAWKCQSWKRGVYLIYV